MNHDLDNPRIYCSGFVIRRRLPDVVCEEIPVLILTKEELDTIEGLLEEIQTADSFESAKKAKELKDYIRAVKEKQRRVLC